MNGKVIATGQLVVQGDSFAFKIESIETEVSSKD
jgi:flagellar motor switch/type III secretory pathway protein FliN